MTHRTCVAALLAPLLFAGCFGPERSELAPVSGTVNFNGQPLASGTIILETTGSRPAVGKIENGQIVEVTTYEPNDGAAIGTHTVIVQSVAGSGAGGTGAAPTDFKQDPSKYMATTSLIPERYGNPARSKLTAEIKPDGPNVLTIELTK